MPRDTSIEAYQRITENGLLSFRRMQVYEYLFQHGPCTARQITLALRESEAFKGKDVTDSGFHGRLSELRDRGVVSEVGRTEGENGVVILWDVTSKLPEEPPEKVSEKKRMESEIVDLRSEIRELRKLLREARALLLPAQKVSPRYAAFIQDVDKLNSWTLAPSVDTRPAP